MNLASRIHIKGRKVVVCKIRLANYHKSNTSFIVKNPFLSFKNSAANKAPVANPFRLWAV